MHVMEKESVWMKKKKIEFCFCLSFNTNKIRNTLSLVLFINIHCPYLANSNIALRLNIKTNKLDHYHMYTYSTKCIYPPSASNTYSLVLLLLLVPSRISHCSWQSRYHYHSWHTHTYTYSFRMRTIIGFIWHAYKLKNAVRSIMCNVW